LKRHKSPGIEQIPAELIEARGNTLRSEIHKLINCIWNKEELPEKWEASIIVPIYKKGDETAVVIIEEHHCYKLHTKSYTTFFCLG
jgi:hypothetical protein